MGGLFGSSPSVKTTTQPTIDPAQQALLNALAPQLTGGTNFTSIPSFGQEQGYLAQGQFAAPLSGLQSTSLQGIENLINTYTGGPASGSPGVSGPLSAATSATTGALTANPVSMIDPTQAFQQGVVQPLTQDFTTYTIPAISGQYGQSAGGAYSSDQQGARQRAGTDLARTLAQAGSQYSLAANTANQSAQATNAQLRQAAAALVPSLAAAPLGIDQLQGNILSGGLTAGGIPQATQQQQISGEYQNYGDILAQIQQRLSDALGLSTAQTQQTQSVVNPGQTGLIPSLLAAAAGGFGRSYGQSLFPQTTGSVF